MPVTVFCIIAVLGAEPEAPALNSLTVTYVGNTGYPIESQGHKIAIDALFGGFTSKYYDVPADSIVDLMKTAQLPFDNIDIIAITHWHDDHFNAGIVAEHLTNDTPCRVLCPLQVAERLATQPQYGKIKSQIYSYELPVDSVVSWEQRGVLANILCSHHGSYWDSDSAGNNVDIHRETQNLEFFFTIGNHSLFHCGDAQFQEKYRYLRLGLASDSIDIAFVQWWGCHDLPLFGEIIVREELRARHVFVTHLAPGKASQMAEAPECSSHRKVVLPVRSLQQWQIQSSR